METPLDPDLLAALFRATPLPTMLVDDDVEILAANPAATALFGSGVGSRAGELLRCLNSAAGCGRGAACSDCVIRGSGTSASRNGSTHRARAALTVRRDGVLQDVHFLVSAAPLEHRGRALFLLVLEDVSHVVQLGAMVTMCSWCRKVRTPEAFWASVERFLHDQVGLRISHGICDECLERQFPP